MRVGLPIGIWLGIGGYVLIKYGAGLWSGDQKTLAEVVGLSTTDPTGGTTTTVGGPPSVGGFWHGVAAGTGFAWIPGL